MGLVLSDLTDEQKKELDLKSGVLVEDVTRAVRGNVQPGDVILAIVNRGQTHRGQVRGAVQRRCWRSSTRAPRSTLRLRRGEQEFFSTLRINNGD